MLCVQPLDNFHSISDTELTAVNPVYSALYLSCGHSAASGSSFGMNQLRYRTESSNSSNTQRKEGAPAGLVMSLTPEETAKANAITSEREFLLYVNELIEQRSTAVLERSQKEAVFHPGDVLAKR